MKTSAGCTQPVHSVLRRWIGGTSFISPPSRAKQIPLRVSPTRKNDESNTTSSTIRRIALISTPTPGRSISTTRNIGVLTPSSPPLVLADTCVRRLSGTSRVISPEERKLGDDNVDVPSPAEAVPIDLDDLQDLNAEIAGFVGSLGDPDFDVEDNAPTTSAAADRRHGRRYRTDNPDVLEGNLKDRRQHQHEQQEKQQQQRTTDSGSLGHTDPAEARDKRAPSSHLQSRRLTLADHPTSSASAGSRETIIRDVSSKGEAAQRGSGMVEELRAHSAASGTTYPLAGRGEGTPLVPELGTASGSHHARNRVGSRKQGASVEGQGRLSKSVLVLNGAACFVGERLASTGEPQGQVTKLMEEAASEFNISLTVCTSNREHELLDELCAGDYDAVIYNPAGFSAEFVGSASRRYLGWPRDPAHSQLDIRQPPQPEPARGQGLDDRSALEYGLIRAGCPVVTLAPRDTYLGRRVSRGFRYMEDGVSGLPLDHTGGHIAGFSGSISYRLAIAAVAELLESER